MAAEVEAAEGVAGFDLQSLLEEVQGVSKEEKESILEWLQNRPTIRILVTGKAGTGKSTLLNGTLGKKVFAVGASVCSPKTLAVTCQEGERRGIKFVVWDSPGLQDGTDNEKQYLEEMVEKCKEVDLLMYCISMIEVRSDLHREFSAMKKISRAFGPKIWENTLFVLTFANVFEKRLIAQQSQNVSKDFARAVEQWRDKVKAELKEVSVPQEVLDNLRFCTAGRASNPHLSCLKFWFSNFWMSVLATCKDQAQPAILAMNADRFVTEEEARPENYTRPVLSEQPIVVTLSTTEKALIAAGTTVPLGATGATVGALIGALAIGIPTFGVAAGVGLLLGGAIGAGVGVGSGFAVGAIVKYFRRRHRETNS